MEILTEESLVGAKNAPAAICRASTPFLTKGSQVSLVRIQSSHPESDGKSADIWIWLNWGLDLTKKDFRNSKGQAGNDLRLNGTLMLRQSTFHKKQPSRSKNLELGKRRARLHP